MGWLEHIRIAGLVAILVSLPMIGAHAQDADADSGNEVDVYSRNAGYIGIGGALAVENFDDSRGSYEDSAAVMIRAGYRGLRFLSIELVGDILLDFDDDDVSDNDVDGFAATVNAKFHLPLGRIEPFAAIGGGILDLEEDQRRQDREDFVFRFASGLDLHLTEHLVLYSEISYMLGVGDVSDFNYGTLGGGLMVRF